MFQFCDSCLALWLPPGYCSLTWQRYGGHDGGGRRRLGRVGLLECGQSLLDVQVAARAQVGLQPELWRNGLSLSLRHGKPKLVKRC